MENSETLQPLSDQEIHIMALKEWSGILTKLWTAFGKEVNKEQLKVYKDALDELPIGILEHVVEETLKRHRYNSVPTLAEVQDVINDLHPYWQGDHQVHSRPNRDARIKQRMELGHPEYAL